MSDGAEPANPASRSDKANNSELPAYADLRLETSRKLSITLRLQRRMRLVPAEVVGEGESKMEAVPGRCVLRVALPSSSTLAAFGWLSG